MALSEKRTQLYLPLEMFQKLQQMAEGRDVSLAALIRDALAEYLERQERLVDYANDPVKALIGSFEADVDLSKNHYQYLYA